jgi:hypothetical protein
VDLHAGRVNANLFDTTKLPPALEIAGHTFSPLGTTGLGELLKGFADIELPGLEGKIEGMGLFLSTARLVSLVTSPREKTIFEKWISYPKELLPIINGILDVVGSSHPALLSLKPGLDAVSFVIKTTEGAYALICELETGHADASAMVKVVIG